jgi:hypothetical protein
MERGIETFEQLEEFDDAGYQGLYDNLDKDGLRTRFGIWPLDEPEDYMGDVELAANIFQKAQTRDHIRRHDIQGAEELNNAHYDIGVEVRRTIERIGGTMPEELPRHPPLARGEYLTDEEIEELQAKQDSDTELTGDSANPRLLEGGQQSGMQQRVQFDATDLQLQLVYEREMDWETRRYYVTPITNVPALIVLQKNLTLEDIQGKAVLVLQR